MKKPILILTTLVTVTASSVAFLSPPGSGVSGADSTDRKVQGLANAGIMTPAQAEALKRMRAAAAGHASESNSSMSDPAKQAAPDRQGAQSALPSQINGQPAPGAPPKPTPPPPPPAPPKWRLEGTMVGGNKAPSAVFVVEGWGEALIHPGEKLNSHVKVVAIHGREVTLLTDGKKRERISPW